MRARAELVASRLTSPLLPPMPLVTVVDAACRMGITVALL
jgi:hypothetical protein